MTPPFSGGGGGFFELKWDYSSTGTTLDLSEETLSNIKKPVLFNCIGTSIAKGATASTKNKFENFLDLVTRDNKYMVTVRNDGSFELINELYNKKFSNRILKVPDGGFFCELQEYRHYELLPNAVNIAINIAGDMPEIRFPNQGSTISKDLFIDKFAVLCNELLEYQDNIRIIFVPHIYSDLGIISRILEKIKDEYLRTRVTCSGYYNGLNTDGLASFDIYRNCDLILGMRYHANVVPIGMNKPTILLGTYDAHIKLYQDLDIMHRCICVNEKDFEEKLLLKIKELLTTSGKSKAISEDCFINENLQKDNDAYMEKIKDWLESQN